MSQSKADIILHPVRMKIIQYLAKGDATGYEIVTGLPQIPQATLYRHLNILNKEHIIAVIDEKQIRGAVEKTYSLQKDGARINAGDFKNMSEEEQMQLLTTLYFDLLNKTEDYIKSENTIEKDPFGFNRVELHLTEDEFHNMRNDLIGVYKKYNDRKTTREKRTIHMTQIFLPEPGEKWNEGE
ncbi:ArsR family transcriptional regulator [Bacillus sp. N1-1]|jgi:DNA-binding transcriptional ArsR family regulator|uniref:ArsR family transcriptional regulator n=1 Tax=Bacillus sp. N1-1 TaxID=2682541 RepID=UPI0013198A50|nr:ArsR family transcriptional regulator [Bacillus sp. N1-1]QHA93587.1 helix-turn-helix domain-containing protein [Bacillus sp. N1-1]